MQKFCDIRACDNFLKDLEITLPGKTRAMCNLILIETLSIFKPWYIHAGKR